MTDAGRQLPGIAFTPFGLGRSRPVPEPARARPPNQGNGFAVSACVAAGSGARPAHPGTRA